MLNVGQTDLTPWLIGIGVVVFLLAIIVITLVHRQQQNGTQTKRLRIGSPPRRLCEMPPHKQSMLLGRLKRLLGKRESGEDGRRRRRAHVEAD